MFGHTPLLSYLSIHLKGYIGMTLIFWAGDSTVKENKYTRFPQTGIGQEFHRYLKQGVMVINHGENGRSTKSFLDESRLVPIYDEIKEGDFLFVQFGHNDEKIEDPDRYTDSQGEFQNNLKKFIHVAKNKKANPVLITPVERRCFQKDGSLRQGTHRIYAEAMINVARSEQVPLIDLNLASHKLIEEKGIEITKNWFMHIPPNLYPFYPEGLEDDTHLQPEGAYQFGGLIARELEKLGGIYGDLLYKPE